MKKFIKRVRFMIFSNKPKIFLSVILCVCLVLGTYAILFVKAGIKIAETPKRELFLCVKDSNILFESLKNADVYFEYDIQTNKIKKHFCIFQKSTIFASLNRRMTIPCEFHRGFRIIIKD